MNLSITIPIDEYNALKEHSLMLGRIAGVVGKYDRRTDATTYERVLRLHERERKLTETIKKMKEARKS